MDKFEEFYKQHCLDHFGYDPDLNWIFEKHEDGSYIQIEVENAKKVFNHQQAKVEELQKRLYGALKETQYALQYVEGDMRGNHEFLKMAMIRTFKALEQALKGEGQ